MKFCKWLMLLLFISSFQNCRKEIDPSFERIVIDPFPGKLEPKAKVITDIDGDGFADILFNSTDGFHWYKYPVWDRFLIGDMENGEDAQAADIDADGDMDIVFSPVFKKGLKWWENPMPEHGPENGPWKEHLIHTTIQSHDVLVGDINGDELIDVVCEGGMLIQQKNGEWVEIPNTRFDGMSTKEGSAIHDIDMDGDLDFLRFTAESPYKVVWYENPLPNQDCVTHAWTPHVIGDGFKVTSINAGDVDNDGLPDVVIAPMYKDGAGLYWFKGPQNPQKNEWQKYIVDDSLTFSSQNSLLVHDFNRDGKADILAVEMEQSPTDRIVIFYNEDGNGYKWRADVIATTGSHNPKYGDIDDDGDIDILNANHGWTGIQNPVEIWRNLTK